jgi:hypothetical protein
MKLIVGSFIVVVALHIGFAAGRNSMVAESSVVSTKNDEMYDEKDRACVMAAIEQNDTLSDRAKSWWFCREHFLRTDRDR